MGGSQSTVNPAPPLSPLEDAPGNSAPPRVCGVAELTREHGVAFIGGKVYNTGRLVRAGLPVPRALLVSTLVYDDVAGEHELLREDAMAAAREAIMAAAIPADVVAAVASFFEQGKAYAVRSSATVEDSGDSAFAGQFDTFLVRIDAPTDRSSTANQSTYCSTHLTHPTPYHLTAFHAAVASAE